MASDDKDNKQEFLKKLRGGDPGCFREWVRQTRPLVEALLMGIVGNADVTADLSQQVYIRAFAKLHSVRDADRLQAWLAQLTRNLARDWLRRRAVRKREFDRYARDFARAWIEPTEPDDAPARQRERLRNMVGQLPEELREVVLLRYYAGKTYEEIARQLDVPLTTIDGRMRTAKRRLAEMLKNETDEGP